ncbi:hypothetical protein ACTXT7_014634 [Hymenolepis weldensis]
MISLAKKGSRLIPEVTEFVLDVISKPSNTPYNELKLAHLELTTTICPPPETESDTKRCYTYNREYSKKLPFMGGGSNSDRGEKKRYPPEQVSATHKRRANRERNALKPL